MIYSFARIGAVVAMKVEDYYPGAKRWWVRLHESWQLSARHSRSARNVGLGEARYLKKRNLNRRLC
jgi:hypothetical protein